MSILRPIGKLAAAVLAFQLSGCAPEPERADPRDDTIAAAHAVIDTRAGVGRKCSAFLGDLLGRLAPMEFKVVERTDEVLSVSDKVSTLRAVISLGAVEATVGLVGMDENIERQAGTFVGKVEVECMGNDAQDDPAMDSSAELAKVGVTVLGRNWGCVGMYFDAEGELKARGIGIDLNEDEKVGRFSADGSQTSAEIRYGPMDTRQVREVSYSLRVMEPRRGSFWGKIIGNCKNDLP